MRASIETVLAEAKDRGVNITAREAERLLQSRRPSAACELVASIGALIDLGSALGYNLPQLEAFKRLERADDDYDQARDVYIADIERGEARRMSRAFHYFERLLRSQQGHERHAVFVGHSEMGSLGWQASILLRAADDAGIDVDRYRVKLGRIVGSEISRRYPSRDVTVSEEGSAHLKVVKAAQAQEDQAKQLVLHRRPELGPRIDAMASRGLNRQVDRWAREIRDRLRARAEEGWHPDPERFDREVLLAAAAEASGQLRTAS